MLGNAGTQTRWVRPSYLCSCECNRRPWDFLCLWWRSSFQCDWPWCQAGPQPGVWCRWHNWWWDHLAGTGNPPSASHSWSPPAPHAGRSFSAWPSCGSFSGPASTHLQNKWVLISLSSLHLCWAISVDVNQFFGQIEIWILEYLKMYVHYSLVMML